MLSLADAYQLMHDGSVVLAQIEANGIRIDIDYLEKQIDQANRTIRDLETDLRSDKLYGLWRREFGERARLGSNEQLGHILFDVLKIPYQADRTATGRYRTDRVVLEEIDIPFVKKYLQLEDLRKDKSTFLEGIRIETVDGYLHPFFHLASGEDDKGGARSMRGSSSSPNFQNFPNRDPRRAKVVRDAFIPRNENYQLGEVDFKAAEVSVAACVTKDPNLMAYVTDAKRDMHRDMAMRLFTLDEIQAKIKNIRNTAKACFVFAQFYGDFYVNCARNIWNHILKDKLALADGTPLDKHLRRQGIKKLGACDPEQKPRAGTFEEKVKEEERYFWYEMFPVYTEWKKKYYQRYLETAAFSYTTGFRIEGEYAKNQVLNYPIQGPSFHCLLWTIIQLQRWLVKKKMRTRIVGQIHDSIVLDFHRREIQDVLHKVKYLVREKLPRVWDWVIVPLTVEIEIAPLGATWWAKKPWIEKAGQWVPEKD